MAKVLIGAPCGKLPVYDMFYDAFARLDAPKGSTKARMMGGSVPQNLNKLVDEALKAKMTHLFIVEDDSWFEKDTLTRLLAHNKPVVAGLCRSRQWPFRPYVYEGIDPAGNGLLWHDLTPADKGLIKVAATGMGGILINMSVFKALGRPYFDYKFINEVEWGQDILFGKSLIDAGIDVYCDLDVTIWHATQCVIGSSQGPDGKWAANVKINEGMLKLNLNYV